ncbi:hypothetical protein LWI29_000712 [Acer saccharum]|uniref:Uncharacterized protein n=1 Tax=Acer saccharum TaxID=4024 RepID=A0AA39VZQ5_ACESA|nr:hypothetical protein LWI29_000712 [Acer saccharum]
MQGYLNRFLGNIDIVNSQEVWSVLKPGFLALLEDPFNTRLLDIIVFDVLPTVIGNGGSEVNLANQIKESNPLHYAFKVIWFYLFGYVLKTSTIQCIQCLQMSKGFLWKSKHKVWKYTSKGKVKDWVAAINDAGLRPLEGWCHPHRFGSFAPPR